MPYRVRSTDVWYNAPGVVAAYQPIAAPGPLVARYNQAHGGSNLHKATGTGAAPAWGGGVGWRFSGAEFLVTTIFPASNWSLIVQFANAASDNGDHCVFGCWSSGQQSFAVWQDSGGLSYYMNPNFVSTTRITAGSLAIAGQVGYKHGKFDTNLTGTTGQVNVPVAIGAGSAAGGQKFKGDWCAGMISSVSLSAAHIAQYSRQMAYCHVNPEWSAWGRRRRYYYAPSEAASAAKMNTYFRRMRS